MDSADPHYAKSTFDTYISGFFHKVNEAPTLDGVQHYDRTLGPYLPESPDTRILEIGVGMGHFALFATHQRRYRNYFGIDLSKECIGYVRDHVTANVLMCSDTLEYLRDHKQQYDVIVMLDVIEHVEKRQQQNYLEAVRFALCDGGVLLLRTENMAAFTGWYQHVMDYTHEYNFSPASLEQLCRLAGFESITLFGDPTRVTGARSLCRYVLLRTWHRLLRFLYELERPGCVNPTILTKNLYAVCRK